MTWCNRLFAIFLLSLFLHSRTGEQSYQAAYQVIIKGISEQDIATVKRALEENKSKLSSNQRRKIVAYVEEISQEKENEAWFSFESKKSISSTLCVIAAMVAFGSLSQPSIDLLRLILFYKHVAPAEWRNFLLDPTVQALIVIAFVSFGIAIITGYDNITGYYSEPSRYIQDLVEQHIPGEIRSFG